MKKLMIILSLSLLFSCANEENPIISLNKVEYLYFPITPYEHYGYPEGEEMKYRDTLGSDIFDLKFNLNHYQGISSIKFCGWVSITKVENGNDSTGKLALFDKSNNQTIEGSEILFSLPRDSMGYGAQNGINQYFESENLKSNIPSDNISISILKAIKNGYNITQHSVHLKLERE